MMPETVDCICGMYVRVRHPESNLVMYTRLDLYTALCKQHGNGLTALQYGEVSQPPAGNSSATYHSHSADRN